MDEGQIYQEYQPKVRAYVRGKIQDPHDAQDLVTGVHEERQEAAQLRSC